MDRVYQFNEDLTMSEVTVDDEVPAAEPEAEPAEPATEPAAEPEAPAPESEPDKAAEVSALDSYRELLKSPEVKAAHQADIDRIFNRRYRTEIGSLKDELRGYGAVMEKLHTAFGTNDIASLEAALETKTELYQAKADELGVDVSVYKRMLQTEREASRYRSEQSGRMEAERAQAAINERIAQEAEEFADEFPGVDVSAYAALYGDLNSDSNRFMKLVRQGVSLTNAYKILSFAQNAQAAKAVETPAPKPAPRPKENASGGNAQPAADTPRKLSQKEIETLRNWG